MKKFTYIFLLSVLTLNIISGIAQTINIHSIDNDRMIAGDYGYTLNGQHMMYTSLEKLKDTTNFGPTGTYGKSITVTNDYALSGSLVNISSVPNIDLFYFGSFDKNNFWMQQFTDAEIDSLYNWSVRGGKMIIGGAAAASQFNYQTDILDSKWNFEIALASLTSIYPTAAGSSSLIFNGPFGSISTANQGGNFQGYFSSIPEDAVVLADDGAGNPTLYLDCKTLDLVMSDADGFNEFGGVSWGGYIFTDNDKFWTNAIAYMDHLQSPPEISQTWNTLSTGEYSTYQWYLNGEPIAGARDRWFEAMQSGNYSVKVALNCGCDDLFAQSVYVTVGVDEISDVNISMWPNPISNGNLFFSGIDGDVNVKIINSVGVVAENEQLNNRITSIDASKLTAGIYSVSIENKNGRERIIRKLIKN